MLLDYDDDDNNNNSNNNNNNNNDDDDDDDNEGAHSGLSPAGLQATQAIHINNMDGLDYHEYFGRIGEICAKLKRHWNADERVGALKVAIQLSKLLADASQIKLYARKHKLITETLDNFGLMVYNRMHKLAGSHSTFASSTPDDQTKANNSTNSSNSSTNDNQIGPTTGHLQREFAKETCRNWFLKVASIRELLPRYYIELAILRACDILLLSATRAAEPVEVHLFTQSLKRLTRAAWGIGDPVVALHARFYLCRVCERLIGWGSEVSRTYLSDLIVTNLRCCTTLIRCLDIEAVARTLSDQSVDLSAYFDLLCAPTQSILRMSSKGLEMACLDVNMEMRPDHFSKSTRNANDVDRSGKYQGRSSITDEEKQDSDSDKSIKLAKGRPELALNCLVDETLRSDCSMFARNVLVYSALQSVPSEVIAGRSKELLSIIQMNHQSWKEEHKDQCTDNDYRLDATFYLAFSSFLSTIDGNELFAKYTDSEFNGKIIKTAISIMDDVQARQKKALKGAFQDQKASHDLLYLRFFKSLIRFAKHHSPGHIEALCESFE